MPPRGRSKKGLQRIDAAYDALLPLGFSKDLVRNTINDLLKVYGGHGWFFIEEFSYKLVIDTILKQQEKDEDNKDDEAERNEMLQIVGEDVDNPTALELSEPAADGQDTSLHPEVITQGLQSGGLISDGCENELPPMLGDARLSELPVIAGDADVYTDQDIDLSSPQQPNPRGSTRGATPSGLQERNPHIVTGEDGSGSLQRPNEVARRRRPPCYGWISESESEDDG